MNRITRTFAAALTLIGALSLGPVTLAQHAGHGLETLDPAGAITIQEARPALWKVADADTTIYLFGTIHLLPPGVEWYSGGVAAAFESSAELVTEIPDLTLAETQEVTVRRAFLPKGKSLRRQMSKAQLAKFDTALMQLNLPLNAFDQFKPWYAAVMLSVVPLQRGGFDLANGVEAQLAARNKARGAPRIGLETLDYQLGLFDGLSPKVQKEYLLAVVDALPTIDTEVGKIVSAWSAGDAEGLAALMNAEQEDPAMMQALLTDRNKAWAAWLRARLDTPGTVFVAVGAGHLGGKDSVQDYLARGGVATQRVQ
ncbi:TraB/GumN family protein [Novosphingobium sp.]|uniref:TraB/GumN family protein n=1 Tax=Novosphingobium sp. TaxID=1874826 RepID=UPI0027365F0E|nr:TraB/GumN family protein [Novosphingobium sp.]MDP3905932.1 TraB/GumN family protein [Novosphingobium sp.]